MVGSGRCVEGAGRGAGRRRARRAPARRGPRRGVPRADARCPAGRRRRPALQCSPDHPWVAAHPEWFTTRADGTIAYAENPPKKYQDIYPLSFDNDPEGISAAIRGVLQVWIDHGVTIFRVDNPHTKPLE